MMVRVTTYILAILGVLPRAMARRLPMEVNPHLENNVKIMLELGFKCARQPVL